MRNGWRKGVLEDIVAFNPIRNIQRGATTPFVSMAALPTAGRDFTIDAERKFKGGGSRFCNGDTLFARITPCLENGKTGLVSGMVDEHVAHGSTEFIVLSPRNSGDVHFVYYLARLAGFRNYAIGKMEGTSGRQRVPWQSLRHFELPVPPADDRAKIGGLLSKLDDKITLCQQMNETLEGMALAIFKDWFVDFGPVKAKKCGERPIGPDGEPMNGDLLALFPNKIDPSTDRPEGWGEIDTYSIANFVNGAAYKNIHFSNGEGLPVVKIAELKSGVTPQTKFTLSDLGEKYKIDTGDVMFSWSGSPDTSIDTFIWGKGPAWLNQHIFAVRENGYASIPYVYFLLKSLKRTFIEIARDKQTTGLGHVTIRDMKSLRVAAPSEKVMAAFAEIAKPIFDKILENMVQVELLSTLRDTLLPKLMSGAISVDEIKAIGLTGNEPAQPTGTDLFGEVALTPDEELERDTVMVAAAVKALQFEDQVVGNVRYQKAFYFTRRRMGLPVDDFLPKAAGPYNHELKYGGGYEEALKRQFIRTKRSGDIEGNVTASNIAEIAPLVAKYQMADAISWVKEHLRGKSRDELELWATVDQAALLLGKMDREINVGTVVELIGSIPEWKPKLNRSIFSRPNIAQALGSLTHLPNAY